MANLSFYTNPQSRGQIAHWMLEEVGVAYETVWLEWGENGSKSASYLAINPMGKVPCIVHEGQVITEAAAICLYLAEAFPQAKLLPPRERLGDYYRWTLFCAGPVEQAVTTKAMGWTVPPERSGMLGFGNFESTLHALSQHLMNNDFVCGKNFTAADVYVGSTVQWGLLFKSLPPTPVLTAYAERLNGRAALQRSRVINQERLAAKT